MTNLKQILIDSVCETMSVWLGFVHVSFLYLLKKLLQVLSQPALKFHSISIFLMVLNSIVFIWFYIKNCFETLPNYFERETVIIVLPSIKSTIFHSTNTEIGLAWVKKRKLCGEKNFQKISCSKKNGHTKSEQRNNYVNLENSKALFILHFPSKIHKSAFGLTLLWAKIYWWLSRYIDSSQWRWNIVYVTSSPANTLQKVSIFLENTRNIFFCGTYYS